MPIGSRFAAAILDLLLGFFIAFALAGTTRLDIKLLVILIFVAGYLYRLLFHASPGQQMMQLGHPLATFPAALAIILYAGLTFSLGAFVRPLVDAKLTSKAIDAKAVAWQPPAFHAAGVSQWIDGAVLTVPGAVNGWKPELAHCCVFYGPYVPEQSQPGLMITVLPTNHPYEYCRGAANRWARYLAGCDEGPLAFQRAFLEASREQRNRALSPLAVVRRNFALIARSQTLEDMNPGTELRVFQRGGTQIIWIVGTLKLKKETGQYAPVDHFFLADDQNALGVDLIWKQIPRDPSIAEQVASSLRMLPRNEVASGLAQQAGIPRLYNATRAANYTVITVDELIAAVQAGGTPRERHYLATHLTTLGQTQPALRLEPR